MRSPFLIGDTGAELIFAEWMPGNDPETEAAALMRLANAVGDWSAPMVESRAAIIEDTKQHFAHQEDPWGEPWEELNEEYRYEKLQQGYPDEILVRTGRLKDGATSDAAWMVTEREILFTPTAIPFYGIYHQFAQNRQKMRERAWAKGIHVTHQNKGLPQRAFIGISEECENEIEAIFLNWLNGTTDVVYPPKRGPGSGGLGGGLGGAFGLGYGASRLGEFPVYKVLPTGQPLLRTPGGGYVFGRGTSGGYRRR